MRGLKQLSVGQKLTFIALVTSGVALLLAFLGFMAHEIVAFRRSMRDAQVGVARMVGENVSAALTFNDVEAAEQTLRAVAVQDHVLVAALYDRHGRRFASYQRADVGDVAARRPELDDGHRWSSTAFELTEEIKRSGETIGTVYLRLSLDELSERLRTAAVISLVVLGVAVFGAYFVTRRLRRLITGPVSHLAAVAGAVAAERNYSVRARKQTDDELGELVDTFNAMLDQIESGDRALRDAHDQLEQRVELRTRELQRENAERRRSEQALSESNERFQIVTRATTDAVWDWNIGAGTLWWSENYLALFGGAEADVPTTIPRWKERMHPADAEHVCARLQETLDGSRNLWSAEYRFRRHDGTHAFVFDRGYILRDDQGRPVRMIGALQDITDLKRAQEQVATERARFKFIFDSVPVGISLVMPGSDETPVANPAHQRITGVAAADLHLPGVFARASHPEDYERQRALVQRYKRGEIDRFTLEKRYLHPDGRTVWATLTRRMFVDPATGGRQSITTVVDITPLKAAQEQAAREQARFKFLFDAVPVGISLVRPGQDDSRIVNPAHERITGVSVEASRRSGGFEAVSHPDDYRRQRELMTKYSAGEIDHFTLEKRYLHPGGRIVWAALTSRLFTEPATGQKQSVITLVDITERKQAEANLAETHKQLLDTSRRAGMAEVATGVLHNVGNVLNSVNVSATVLGDLVRESKIDRVARLRELVAAHEADLAGFFSRDPRGRQLPGYLRTLSDHLAKERTDALNELESLRKNIDHIKEIVAMQQNYAKVSGVAETLAVAEVIDDALRMTADSFERHEVQLVHDYRARPVVTLEKHKVLHILVNLLRNAKIACAETGRHGKQVTLRVTAEAGRVRIAVIDNGVGIAPEHLTRIFAHGFTTRKNGHGFGLHSGAIAARELGGSLTAESAGPGCGATFVLELPDSSLTKAA